MPDRYTYPGTEILVNKQDRRDPLTAHEAETRLAYQRLVELAAHPIAGDFDLGHWQAIHQHVYQDLWEWAGQLRTVDTGTTNTALAHCRPEFIVDQARIVFYGIKADDFLNGMDHDTVADRLAYHWGETTALHPFRDGNSRSSRAFFDQLTREAGWSIDWQMINDEMDQFKHARLIAHAGNHEPLRDVLAPTLNRSDSPDPAAGLAGSELSEQIASIRSNFAHPSHEATRPQTGRSNTAWPSAETSRGTEPPSTEPPSTDPSSPDPSSPDRPSPDGPGIGD